MSIINRMLQDLDRRNAPGEARQALPEILRPLPHKGQGAWHRPLGYLLVMVGGVLLAGLGWRLWPIHAEDRRAGPAIALAPVAAAPVAVDDSGASASKPISAAPARKIHPPETTVAKAPAILRSAPGAAQEQAPGPGIQKQMHILSRRERAEAMYQLVLERHASAGVDYELAALRQILAVDPTYIAPRQTAVARLLGARRLEEAMVLLREGLDMNLATADFALALARIQTDQGQLEAAIATLAGYLPAAKDPAYRAYLAALQQRLGNHAEALTQYREVVRLSPNNGIWWVGLGISAEALGQGVEALDAFKQARAAGNLSAPVAEFVDKKIRRDR